MKTQRTYALPVILQLKYRLCLLTLLLLASVFGYSQNITKFEYFIDTDPGVGLGTQVNVTPATSITDFNIPVSTSALTPGFHTLYIRSQNELGNWTHTHFRTFFVDNTVIPPTISSFNPSSGLVGSTVIITGTNFSTVPANNTVRFNGTQATVTASTSTSLTVTVPVGATTGLISVVVGGLTANSGTSYTVTSPNLTAAEYFFNTDPGPGNGNAITITPGTTIDLANINIPTTSLAVGWHTVCVRTRDANNVWGFYECRRIYVREAPPVVPPQVVEPITAMEFFYNTDNGPSTGAPITITSSTNIDLVNNNFASTLPVGWHTVSVRAKNNANVWGFYESRRIYVREPPQPCCPPPSPIVELEYFVDADPGAGLSSTRLAINPSQTNIDLVDELLDVGTQSLGAHKIYIRAKNQNGDWSMTEGRDFTVITGCPILTAPSATGVSRCDPGSVTLTGSGASAGETYRWYATNTSVTPLFTGNPYATESLNANTTFYVTAYNPTTFCESGRTPVTASISGIPKPVLSISGSLTVCEGITQTITAPNGFVSYTWSNGLTTQQITATTTGSYSVVVNNGVCSSPPSDAFVFTVNVKPTKPTITSTNGGSLCANGSVTLSAPNGLASYIWSSGQTTASINVNTIGSFFVTVTNASGCQSVASDPFLVTATDLSKPTVTVTGNTALCNSSTVELSAPSGFSSYVWSNGATTQNIIVSTAGSYSLVVSNGSCTSPPSDAVVVTSVAVPTKPSININGSAALCNGAFAVLSAPIGFSNYKWSNGEDTRQIVVAIEGSFTVQTGNASNCLSVASDPVVITLTGATCGGVTTPSITNASRCGNGSVTLNASGATGSQEYRWYDAPIAGALIFTGSAFSTPSLKSSTFYYVAIYDPGITAESNRVIATATVVNIAKPVTDVTGSVSICAGGSTTISAPSGFATYLWTNGATTQQVTVSASGSFSVQVGDGTCSSVSSDVVTVTSVDVPAKPDVTINGSTALCNGAFSVLSAPSGFANYLWSTGETTRQIVVTLAGNYWVRVGQAAACWSVDSDPISITHTGSACGGGPTTPASPVVTSASRCGSGSVTLTATGASGGQIYRWYDAAVSGNLVFTGADFQTPLLTFPTNYYAAIFDSSTGESTRTVGTATIITVPAKPTITIVGREFVCAGAVVALTAPTNFTHYKWSTNETTQTILVDKSGLYTVQVGMSLTCMSERSDEKEVKIGTPAQCGIVPSASNKAPVIKAFSFGVAIGSSDKYPILDLVSDENNNLDITTLRIVDQPSLNGKSSGGKASLDAENNLLLDYKGTTFAGKENFTLQVCDLDGICTQQTMEIDVVGDVIVFNGVTPNGDGINDFMRIQFIEVLENAKKNKVTIFNRWGEVVFEIEDYNNVDRVFIGNSSKGSQLPFGTYLYKVALSGGKEYTGFLTLKN